MYITIVELPEYIKEVDKLLDKDTQKGIKDFLALNPKTGQIIQGTRGIRKLRWTREGKGKSGCVRVIYYFYNETIPLFLLNIFGKNEKSSLTRAECNKLAKLTTILVETYGAKK